MTLMEACDYVEKMRDQMKATDLGTGKQDEHFVIYMYVTGSDDSGSDTVEENSNIYTASESETFH